MAASLKELFQNFTVKIAEKFKAINSRIDNLPQAGGISEDEGQALIKGSDNLPFYKEMTDAEIKAAYERNTDTNAFTDALKQTVENYGTNLTNKADLDPVTGKLVLSQIPNYSITEVISAAENTLADFIGNVNNYTFDIGDVIVIDNAGILTHYFYNGEDKGLETSYSEVNPATLSTIEWGSVSGKPAEIQNLSGTNTGDQDLSGLATTVEVDNKDATTLQSAKDYTDANASSYDDTQIRADFAAADDDLAVQIDAVEEDILLLEANKANDSEVVKGILNSDGTEIPKDEFGKVTLPIQTPSNTINTLIELKEIEGGVDDHYFVLGRTKARDGLVTDKPFYWDATSEEDDNGGTIIQVTGVVTGRWIAEPIEINLCDFGASETTTGLENKLILAKAVNAGYKKVIIDDYYPVSGSGDVIELPAYMSLEPKYKGCGFYSTDSGVLFSGNVSGELFRMEGLVFTNETPTNEFKIIQIAEGSFIEKLTFSNNTFTGNIRAVEHIGAVGLDPEITLSGIKNLEILFNKGNNLINTYFIRIENSACLIETIKGNEVNNLGGVFFGSFLNNSSTNKEAILQSRKQCEIKNNVVFNDDDYNPIITGTYLSFIIHEGKNVVYESNSVTGLRTDSTAGVYDAYLSSQNVTYKNNIWKNNVNFSGATTHNQIIKSKEYDGDSATKLTRVYRSNIFKIEEDWLDRIGKTVSETWNNLYEIPPNSDFTLENNEITLFGCVMPVSVDIVNGISIRNNNIRINYIKGISTAIFYINNISDSPTTITGNQCFIENSSGSELAFIKGNLGFDFPGILSVYDNEVYGDNFRSFIEDVNSEKCRILNNSIFGNVYSFFDSCSFNDFEITNNFVNSKLETGERFPFFTNDFVFGEGYLQHKSIGHTQQFRVPVYKGATEDIRYKVTCKVSINEKWKEVTIFYRIYHDGTESRIQFNDLNGVEVDRKITDTLGNTFMQGFSVGNYDFNLAPLYVDHNNPYILITTPSGRIVKEIKVEILKGNGAFDPDQSFKDDFLENALVNNTRTFTAVQTHSVSPIVPEPTTDYQAATKKYVDDNIGALPKEHQINGTRLTANITGTFNFDWGNYSQFVLTPTGAVTLGNVNLPTGTNTKVISGIFKASAFAVTFPANWKAKANNDPLSDTLDTHFTAETFPDYVLYTLENIPA